MWILITQDLSFKNMEYSCIIILDLSLFSPEIFRPVWLLFKVGVHVNLKEGIKERKLFLEHQQKVAPNPRAAHHFGRGLFVSIFNFKFLFLNYIKSWVFLDYFSKFYYSFEKNYLLTNTPKNHQKICKTPQKSLTLSEVKSWMCPSLKPRRQRNWNKAELDLS